ncbi:MAG TPA: serine protease, partial [Candidatus Saccharimonadales bacterium]|nr:serine protease [Candidatus Saccharimonadales bacterium]
VNDPLSIAITYAFEQINNGNSFYFSQLASASGLTQADLDSGSTNKDKLKIAIDKFYKIPTNRVTASNKSESILVGLGEQQPDLSKLLEATKLNQEYTLPLKTQKAELIGYNYREVDGAQTGVFTASDVALLKISGSNYPNVKLGDISSIVQGSNLNIIGYPGAASTNPLVEASQSIATLTSGKVSAIKTASGSDSKLIETDATIGHGNSGGPAFNDSGEVVGIATYTIDGSGEGDGVYNYIRDIADFKEVVYEKNISLAKSSSTQKTWEDAIELIYEAKYSKALIKLEEVRSLYPDHPKVDSLISYISQRPDQTEDVKDFPVLIASIATLVGILILTLAIILIINHGRRHSAYLEQSRVKNINEDKNGIQNIQV